ncbi:TraG/VirB4 family ATPase [Cupriavidus sp. EM10]
MPVIGEWTGSGRNGALLLVTRRGQPALIDLYESTTNYNGIVFAEAGAGKSFLTQKIVSDYLAEGAKVWAIDAGRSYFKLCKAAKGSFVEFKADSDLCLNPFTFIDNLEEEMDIIKAMIAKMAAPTRRWVRMRCPVLKRRSPASIKSMAATRPSRRWPSSACSSPTKTPSALAVSFIRSQAGPTLDGSRAKTTWT